MEGLSIPSKLYGVLAAGRPVIFIGPRGSEAAALIVEAQCGYTVQPGDTKGAVQAVLAGYEDRALLVKQGQAARSFFERRFDRSIATGRFQKMFQQIYAPSPVPYLHMPKALPPSRHL
jgi:glycosyltransferase involved in cell wall biosynthesis